MSPAGALAAPALSSGVRRITLNGASAPLSALLAEPAAPTPRAVVVALHGCGLTSGYFDGQAHPSLSLLTLGASRGYTVLALDRPGYGRSSAHLPEGLPLTEQAAMVRAALGAFAACHPTGAGFLLLAHSFGGKLALHLAADGLPDLLGLDISGCGHRSAVDPARHPLRGGHMRAARHWGPLGLYPEGTFRRDRVPAAPVPSREMAELDGWPQRFGEVAARVRVPVRFTFAEHERWWLHDDSDLADLAAGLTRAPRVRTERQPGAGHNISLGLAARTYHLRALRFLAGCLDEPGPTTTPVASTEGQYLP